jgi:septum formation protein
VLAADTVVALDGQALGKPVDIADAVSMLERLSGREHDVFTGVALVWRGDLFSAVGATRVRFRGLTRQEIEAYVATDAPLDKAGAYGIQDGGSPVESYEGSYSNVVGLPVALMADLLLQAGLIGGPARATIASEDAR